MNTPNNNPKVLSPAQRAELLQTLQARFEKNMPRHADVVWAKVLARLEANRMGQYRADLCLRAALYRLVFVTAGYDLPGYWRDDPGLPSARCELTGFHRFT